MWVPVSVCVIVYTKKNISCIDKATSIFSRIVGWIWYLWHSWLTQGHILLFGFRLIILIPSSLLRSEFKYNHLSSLSIISYNEYQSSRCNRPPFTLTRNGFEKIWSNSRTTGSVAVRYLQRVGSGKVRRRPEEDPRLLRKWIWKSVQENVLGGGNYGKCFRCAVGWIYPKCSQSEEIALHALNKCLDIAEFWSYVDQLVSHFDRSFCRPSP